jgi:hypothetical protein
MRWLSSLFFVLVLGLMGCSETGGPAGDGGSAGMGGGGVGGEGGTAGDGGSGGTVAAGCDLGLCDGIDCDDEDPCTDDLCRGADGTCRHVAHCDDFNDCTTEACNLADGSCSTANPVADGTSCAGGACQSGACVLSGTVLPCSEQGIRNAIATGEGTYTFACDRTAPVVTQAAIVIDNDVILDGEGKLTVDGNCDHIVFVVNEGATVELTGFAVTQGRTDFGPPLYEWHGGGISNKGTLTLTNSTVSRCSAAESRDPEVATGGGGIGNAGALTLTNSTVSQNSASFSGGGILSVGGTLTLSNSIVSGNTALRGGGIASYKGTLTMTDSTVSDNAATESEWIHGAGIDHWGTSTISNCTVSGNKGVGIQNDGGGTLTVINSTISGNTGDAIHNPFGTLTLTNDTVLGSISSGSEHGNEHSSIVVAATLIDGACTTVGISVVNWTSSGYNIESPSDTCGFDQGTDLVDITEGQLDLGPLTDNGGPTMTHGLGADSVAIDHIPAIDCAVVEDQRGVARPQGGSCDVGAFELEVGP